MAPATERVSVDTVGSLSRELMSRYWATPRPPPSGKWSVFEAGWPYLASATPYLVLRAADAVQALGVRRRVLDDLREAHDGHDVVGGDRLAVDLLEEMDHLLGAAELRVVVLDVPRREVLDPLDLDLVDDRLEDLLPRRVLVADGHQDRLVLLVLVGLVAEPDRGRLAAALELVGEDRRVEVRDLHRPCTLLGGLDARQRPAGHLALALVGQRGGRFGERHPPRVLDLVVVVVEASGLVFEEREGHDLGDPPARALVPVAHVAELLDEARLDPRLLADLARGGVDRALARAGMALWERQHPAPVRRAPGGDDDDALGVLDDDAPGRELALRRH